MRSSFVSASLPDSLSAFLSDGASRLAQRLRVQGENGAAIMGIVNVTPDSFSDGGQFQAPDAAVAQARSLAEEGADILDLGAESTRPGFTPVEAEEEWARLQPVIEALATPSASPSSQHPIPAPALSVDTTKASVARQALKAGAVMVNDVWGFQADPSMASVVAAHGAMGVVMHNRTRPQDAARDFASALDVKREDLWRDWMRFFDRSLEIAERAGVARDALVLDPGIGFGKTLAQNLEALRLVGRLKAQYGLPVLVGASRKSMFAKILGERDMPARLPATLAAHLEAVRQGATIVRVHDVRAHADALKIQTLLRSLQDSLPGPSRVDREARASEETRA